MESVMMAHVLAGMISLVSGLFVFVLKKGTRFHVRIGNVYFVAMAVVFVSSIYVSILKNNIFLLLIGFFSFYLVYSGIRYNRLRKNRAVSILDIVSTLFFGICFLGMFGLGLFLSIFNPQAGAIILAVFGSIGVFLIKDEFIAFFLKRLPESSNTYFRQHIGRMTGSYIAAVTAFLVNNITFLHPLIIWLAPTALGFLVIRFFSAQYKR